MRIIQPVVSKWEKLICSNRVLTEFYAHRYLEAVRKEIALAGITGDDLVLNVGCGALPFTAICTARLTGAKVIAIDRDEKAVTGARSCLESLGLDHLVDVVPGDAADGVPAGFTAAIVALQAEPKAAILRTLLENARPEARIIFRRPSKPFASHYDYLPDTGAAREMVKQEKRTFDASVLYTG